MMEIRWSFLPRRSGGHGETRRKGAALLMLEKLYGLKKRCLMSSLSSRACPRDLILAEAV
ncbi:MAG: hypothetical protein K0S44_1038 [Bacteroidetes bacterium]|jgi:hypothetical protein|nr:hypothetical protein [Bacteroidota bacterium]